MMVMTHSSILDTHTEVEITKTITSVKENLFDEDLRCFCWILFMWEQPQ